MLLLQCYHLPVFLMDTRVRPSILQFTGRTDRLQRLYPMTKLLMSFGMNTSRICVTCKSSAALPLHTLKKIIEVTSTPKSVECVFLGYYPTTKGYRLQRKNNRKIFESEFVRFMPLAVQHPQTFVAPPTEQEEFAPFRHIPSVDDPVCRFPHTPRSPAEQPPALGVFTPITPSPRVGVPSPPSTFSVNHTHAAEVPTSHPACFGQTHQSHTWRQRENPLSSAPLADSVCNLEHLMDEL